MNKGIQLWGLFSREVARFFKVPLQTLGAPIVNAVLYLHIFGVNLGSTINLHDGISYLAFLIPGLIAMSVIKNAFDNSTSSIVGQKYVNELQDLRTTPLTLNQLCISKTAASVTRGVMVGGVTYIIGQIFYLIWNQEFLLIFDTTALLFFIIIGGWGFGCLGIAVGMWAKTFEHIGAISMLVLLPLIYLGGVFFSLESAHTFWQTLSHFNPLFYIINGMRYAMLGISDISLGLAISITILFSAICYILAIISLKKGSRYTR